MNLCFLHAVNGSQLGFHEHLIVCCKGGQRSTKHGKQFQTFCLRSYSAGFLCFFGESIASVDVLMTIKMIKYREYTHLWKRWIGLFPFNTTCMEAWNFLKSLGELCTGMKQRWLKKHHACGKNNKFLSNLMKSEAKSKHGKLI